MNAFGFRVPDEFGRAMTDDELDALVGRTLEVGVSGVTVAGTVRSVGRYDDEMLGAGVWVEMDVMRTSADMVRMVGGVV